jgi:hypothetical protein
MSFIGLAKRFRRAITDVSPLEAVAICAGLVPCDKGLFDVLISFLFDVLISFPNTDFNPDRMSHTGITTYLTYIRLAYPGFQTKLRQAMARPGNNSRQQCLLQNLTDLCQYFIPVVHSSSSLLKNLPVCVIQKSF